MPKLYKRVTAWFELDDDPMGGRIEVAHLEPHEVSAIVGKCTRTLNRIGMGETPERLQELNLELDKQETADMAVVNWENFYGPDDKQLACTSENKRRWALDNWFMGHLKRARAELAERVTREREEAAKN